MRITVFVGSARKRHTHSAAELFLQKMCEYGDTEGEVVNLSDYELGVCNGCQLCFDKGEEFCPLKDDRDTLVAKMDASDGVVFATPNYAFGVSGRMKVFFDRCAFILHRPRYFGKVATSIVVQGIYGGNTIVKYCNFIAGAMGFNTVKGCCINSLEPVTEKGRKRIDTVIDRQSRKFRKQLLANPYPSPSLMELFIFRMSRTSRKLMLGDKYRDYTFFREKQWFTDDYYYSVRLNPITKNAGRLFDAIAALTVKKR